MEMERQAAGKARGYDADQTTLGQWNRDQN